ncbi:MULTISPECIES: hypothetical protein [unclassified Paraburkholderia]|uniref:hypothetical protein n=1 Tax=unclassified Paraburkholderia TaxID=2615204 RepID=UPI002AB000BA|nr:MULTISPECIES: hypothetical protein [unclassified Paraburkholderia]
MRKKSRETLKATAAVAAVAHVIDNEPDGHLASRLAEMQVSKSIRFRTIRGASGEKPSDIREKRTP